MEKIINNAEVVPDGPEAPSVEEHAEHPPEEGADVPTHLAQEDSAHRAELLRQDILGADGAVGHGAPATPEASHAPAKKSGGGVGGGFLSGLGKLFKGGFMFFGGLFAIGLSGFFSGVGSFFKKGKGKGGGHGGGHAKTSHHSAPSGGHDGGHGGGHH